MKQKKSPTLRPRIVGLSYHGSYNNEKGQQQVLSANMFVFVCLFLSFGYFCSTNGYLHVHSLIKSVTE